MIELVHILFLRHTLSVKLELNDKLKHAEEELGGVAGDEAGDCPDEDSAHIQVSGLEKVTDLDFEWFEGQT